MLCFLFTLSQLPLYSYDRHLSTLKARNRKTTPDAAPLLAGLLTTLRQFHAQHVTSYLRLLGQWLRVHVTEHGMVDTVAKRGVNGGYSEFPQDVQTCVAWLETFCKYGDIERTELQRYAPPYVLDNAFTRVGLSL